MRKFATFVILTVSFLSANAWACGDSLYRIGKGVSYRVYTAPLPGNVLVYGRTDSARQLADALAESGHKVQLVDSEVELSFEMGMGNYDVVIASYSDHDAVESRESGHTTYLPVALSNEEAKVAEQSYKEVMLADRDEIKDYLKVIHRTLKARAS